MKINSVIARSETTWRSRSGLLHPQLRVRNDTSTRGFTLVELLVTMSIIMVVTIVGMVSYSNINKQTRDSRRMADLEKVRVALEMYRQVNGSYPVNTSTLVTDNFLQSVPVDPKDPTYIYAYVRSDAYHYTYHAYLELGSGSTGTTCGTAINCNYSVSNP